MNIQRFSYHGFSLGSQGPTKLYQRSNLVKRRLQGVDLVEISDI